MAKNKCKKKQRFSRASCIIKRELCDKRNHEIAKAGARLYSTLNPTYAIAVPIIEVDSPAIRKFVCPAKLS